MPVAARARFATIVCPTFSTRRRHQPRAACAHARSGAGRARVARKLVELGLIKSSELFADRAAPRRGDPLLLLRLGARPLSAVARRAAGRGPRAPRLAPWALFVEGVRRKYALERLVELVGPPETVLTPTTLLARALEDGALHRGRARARRAHRRRALARRDVPLGAVGAAARRAGAVRGRRGRSSPSARATRRASDDAAAASACARCRRW